MNIKEDIENYNFNEATIPNMLDLCLKIENEEDAKRFLERYRIFDPQNADHNLGYIFGYVEPKSKREKLYKLFPVNHPIFGSSFGREI